LKTSTSSRDGPRAASEPGADPREAVAAVQAGHKVRYFTAADLAETLYRGLADNSAGRVIDTMLRNDLILIDEVGFAPLDDTGAQLLFRVVAAAYERRAPGIASHWPCVILSFRVSRGWDLRRPVVDSVADGTLAA